MRVAVAQLFDANSGSTFGANQQHKVYSTSLVVDECGEKLSDFDRFKMAMSQIVGKRLTWNQLTGKLPEPETCVN